MSATNRGSKRKEYDFYATPEESINTLLKNINLEIYGNQVLEPSAGNGNIVRAIHKMYPEKSITAIEIRSEEYESIVRCSNKVIIDDFLTMNNNGKFDIIIGNPPYSKAQEFIEKSLNLLSYSGILIFLLRTSFLESVKRHEFWQNHPLAGLYTLSKRPSFTGTGTDSASYSWFIWNPSNTKQEIKII